MRLNAVSGSIKAMKKNIVFFFIFYGKSITPNTRKNTVYYVGGIVFTIIIKKITLPSFIFRVCFGIERTEDKMCFLSKQR